MKPRPQWAEWASGAAPFTIGVEEELMLLDPGRGWTLAQRIDDVLPALPDRIRGHVAAETHRAALELQTDPHESVAPAIEQLVKLRATLAQTLGEMGLAAAGAGTHPAADWEATEITDAGRYQQIENTMRDLARREPTFALHVHVAVPDPERATELLNRLRVHLPLLLALSGNSPFWRGRDAGLTSTRTFLFQAFPRTGIPQRYPDYDSWVQAIDLQIRAGALPDASYVWWDARLQPKLGTVEVRVMDTQCTCADTAALVALVQSLARLESEDGYVSETTGLAVEALAENRFLAARDGVAARLIDPERAILRPVTELANELLAALAPHAELLGCTAELAGVHRLLERSGAIRQRAFPSDQEGRERMLASLWADFSGPPAA
jgi:carboxylate-amine ligase